MPMKFQNREKSNSVTKSNIILFSCLQFHHGNGDANLSAISGVVEKKEDKNFKYNLIRDYHFFAHSSNPCPIDQVDFRSPGQDNAARVCIASIKHPSGAESAATERQEAQVDRHLRSGDMSTDLRMKSWINSYRQNE